VASQLAQQADQQQLPKSDRVLLLIDFINPLDFPGAGDLAPAALDAALATVRLRQRLDREGVPTIYANDNFGRWHSDFHRQLERTASSAGIAGEIARVLRPRSRDLTILKPRHSAFFASPLEILLSMIGAHRVVVAGIATDMCVQLTAMDGFLRGYSLSVPSNCTAAESESAKEAALAYMATVLKCNVEEAS
jgi:nicotinamidase-related amidase